MKLTDRERTAAQIILNPRLSARQVKTLVALDHRICGMVKHWRKISKEALVDIGESEDEYNVEFIRGGIRGLQLAANELEAALKEK